MLGVEESLPVDASSEPVVSVAASEAATPVSNSAVPPASEEVRDPFAESQAPIETAVVDPGSMGELQGIGFGSKDAYAVMGGEIFFNGDEKNGIKLVEVRRREVDVIMNGGLVTLPLFEGGELQKAKDRAKKKNAEKDASAKQTLKTPSSISGREQQPS